MPDGVVELFVPFERGVFDGGFVEGHGRSVEIKNSVGIVSSLIIPRIAGFFIFETIAEM